MAAKRRGNRAEAAGTSDEVWPPPPTYEAPKPAPQRRLLLPLYVALPQMPKGFSLPGWAKAAFNSIFFAYIAVTAELHAPLVGRIAVGVFVCGQSVVLLSLLAWATLNGVFLAGRALGRTVEAPPTPRRESLSIMGGWIGLVPFATLWLWGLSYLDIYHIHRIRPVALCIWVAWLILGCIVAVVNGVGQWQRERHTPPGTGEEESATG